MTATKASYGFIALKEAGPAAAERGFILSTAPGPRGGVAVRRNLGIHGFGVNAFYQGAAGEPVVGEHDELGPGANRHEELYIVVSGSCTFTVDGEDVDAPHGSVVFVRDPASKRGAIANEDDTIVVVVGGRPGAAFEPSAGDSMSEFFDLYRAGEYADALDGCRAAVEKHPGNPLVLYNVGCVESLLGNQDAALAALAESLPAWPRFKELAAKDDDLIALREDPRFQALVAES